MNDLELSVIFNKNKFTRAFISKEDVSSPYEKCPVCFSSDSTPYIEILNSKKEVIVEKSICSKCDHGFYTKSPGQKWFENFYKNDWQKAIDYNKGPVKAQNYYWLLSLVTPNLKNDEKLLDLGAGIGNFLHTLKQDGYKQLYGTEASQKRFDKLIDRGFKGFFTTGENISEHKELLENAPYDMVTSWHVFEHVIDLKKTITNVKKILKKDGLVCFGVPNFEAEHLLFHGHFLPHFHQFTAKSLQTYLNLNGFEVLHLDGTIRCLAKYVGDDVVEQEPMYSYFGYRDFSDLLSTKIIRDFNLQNVNDRKLPSPYSLLYTSTRGDKGTLEPSYGKLSFRNKSLSYVGKLKRKVKEDLIGLKSVHSDSANDPYYQRKIREYFYKKNKNSDFQCEGDLLSSTTSAPQKVKIVYNSDEIVAWVK